MKKLGDMAKIIRSKNAGPLYLTFDIMFEDRKIFTQVLNSGVLNENYVADIYGIGTRDVSIIAYEAVNAIKVTIPKKHISGSIYDTDIYGCQQHLPMAEIMVPCEPWEPCIVVAGELGETIRKKESELIKKELYEQVVFETICRGTTKIPADVKAAFERAIKSETSDVSRIGLEKTLESMKLSESRRNLLCPDTGWPLFFIKIGNECVLEGGIMSLENAVRKAVARATHEGFLRATMKHPITGHDPGNNIGMNIPYITYKFVPGSGIEITYVAKGGGSECFGGTRHRVVAFADNIAGIEKFVIDSYVASARAGAVCPPVILGIGIGGTANIAANLAKEASCLRTVGSRHPEELFAKMENDLYQALNMLGIGTMGAGGDTSVLAVNIEYAYTHIAGIAVATSTNCMVARRATGRINEDGSVEMPESPNWIEGR